MPKPVVGVTMEREGTKRRWTGRRAREKCKNKVFQLSAPIRGRSRGWERKCDKVELEMVMFL